jgi:glutamate-1-semialdehyde 2,1-aminomutase
MIATTRVQALRAAEERRYLDTHRQSAAAAHRSAARFLYGLPLHWMRDWPLPHPLFIDDAQGNRLRCLDGHEYVDFCLGDTGAMFGHSPEPVARAIAEQAAHGLTAMLPGERLAAVGELLASTFGLPGWQLALSATDANRFVLRWARAITGRPKVLVFDGCYHGTVDETLVDRAADGRTIARASLLGQVHELARATVVVPFNDLAAVERALNAGDIACLLAEPALTNCGLVPPQPGFIEGVQAACHRAGVLFVLDETHTVSSGHGGHARVHGLDPDVLVVGKAIAGGLPCAVYGFTDAVAERMTAAKDAAPPGHSGIGTTLSANLLALAALEANLRDVMTPNAYRRMLRGCAATRARIAQRDARRRAAVDGDAARCAHGTAVLHRNAAQCLAGARRDGCGARSRTAVVLAQSRHRRHAVSQHAARAADGERRRRRRGGLGGSRLRHRAVELSGGQATREESASLAQCSRGISRSGRGRCRIAAGNFGARQVVS